MIAGRRDLPLDYNILRALTLGIVYGVIEVGFIHAYPPDSFLGIAYRLCYVALLFFPFINQNTWVWAADGVFAMTVQDMVYWLVWYLMGNGLPFSWSAYYPVVGNLPLLYVPAIPAIMLLYWKASKERIA